MGTEVELEEDPVTLQTVRWRPKSSADERFVAADKASLLKRINRRDVTEIKRQLEVRSPIWSSRGSYYDGANKQHQVYANLISQWQLKLSALRIMEAICFLSTSFG